MEIGVPFFEAQERDASAKRIVQEGETFIAAYLDIEKAEQVVFKTEDGDSGPVWVDGLSYALITYKEDGLQTTAWYPRSTAEEIAKAFGAEFIES